VSFAPFIFFPPLMPRLQTPMLFLHFERINQHIALPSGSLPVCSRDFCTVNARISFSHNPLWQHRYKQRWNQAWRNPAAPPPNWFYLYINCVHKFAFFFMNLKCFLDFRFQIGVLSCSIVVVKSLDISYLFTSDICFLHISTIIAFLLSTGSKHKPWLHPFRQQIK